MTQATQLLKSIRLSALKVVESSGECVDSDSPDVGSSGSVESVMEEQGTESDQAHSLGATCSRGSGEDGQSRVLTRGPEDADDAQEAAEALSWKGTRLEFMVQHGHTLEQLKAMASVSRKRMLIDGGATNG